jgi:hypothetical protein
MIERPAIRTHRWSTGPAAGLLLAAAALLAAGCGSGDDGPEASAVVVTTRAAAAGSTSAPATGETSSPRAATTGSAATTARSGAAGTAPALELPRSVTYAGLEWTIETAEAAATDGPGEVRLGFTVESRLEDRDVLFPRQLLALRTPDGELVRASGLEGTESSAQVTIAAGTAVAGTAVFDVEGDVDLAATEFVIDEADRVPAAVPLGGRLPDDPYPVTGTVTGTSDPIAAGCGAYYGEQLIVEPLAVTASLDSGTRRASLDHHFVIVDVRFTGTGGDGPVFAACVDADYARLEADGTPRPRVDPTVDRVERGASLDVALVFEVPTDATTLTLGLGADGATEASFPVTLR